MLNRNFVDVHTLFLEIILWNVPFAGSSQTWSHKVNFYLMLLSKWNFMFAIAWTFLCGIILLMIWMIHNRSNWGHYHHAAPLTYLSIPRWQWLYSARASVSAQWKILVLSAYWFSFFAALIISQHCFNWRKAAHYLNTLRSRQNGHHFQEDIFKCIFLNKNVPISIIISPKFVQIMAWRWPGDKPLSEPLMVILLTHICITWPQ